MDWQTATALVLATLCYLALARQIAKRGDRLAARREAISTELTALQREVTQLRTRQNDHPPGK
jgi:hypothetical protein